MGTQHVRQRGGEEERRAFTQGLIRDLRALERLIAEGRIESGVHRIGAEQELVIVDALWRANPINELLLRDIDDEHFTTELGRFNLEFNLDPLPFGGRCLSELEADISRHVEIARDAAQRHGADVLLAGILPTLDPADLDLRNMTDRPRYHALNDVLSQMRGAAYELRMKGDDELVLNHRSIMLEACNTSFQMHFQVSPERFAVRYNAAQAALGPVLAVAVNSPLLFGRRLWQETRIALFQQSVDTRKVREDLREFQPRVSFGNAWVRESVLEIFQEDIARFKPIFTSEASEDPGAVIDAGGAPSLGCLRLHNSTVYRWNRPCYGAVGSTPHLRIENRVLPAGPTPADEVASAALWLGLMLGIVSEHGDIADRMSFDDARSNFMQAARYGLDTQLAWPGLGRLPAGELVADHLVPLASRGLTAAGLDAEDVDRYMGIIDARARTRRTGAQWMLRSLSSMPAATSRRERLGALAASMAERQAEGSPVHTWADATIDRTARAFAHVRTVGSIMTTDLFTVNEADVIDFAAALMEWQHIRHIPVEDDDHRLVGIVTHRDLLRHLAQRRNNGDDGVPVSEIMQRRVITARPEMPTLVALDCMREHRIGCLPVVDGDRLVGLVTVHDLFDLAVPILRRELSPFAGGDPDLEP